MFDFSRYLISIDYKGKNKPSFIGSNILAINTFNGIKTAVLVGMVDGFTKLDSFSFHSDTEVYFSCSLVVKGIMYVFGGSVSNGKTRQISKVSGCGLNRTGTLNFDFYLGACTVTQGKILLCFDWAQREGRVCRASSSPTGLFSKISDTNHHHYMTKIASTGGKSIICYFLKNILSLRHRYGCRKF